MTFDPTKPPEKAKRFLRLLTEYRDNFNILEDMDAAFEETGREQGFGRARRWYWMESLTAFFKYLCYLATWSFIMLKNYWKTAVRNMRRQKVFSIVNILGLSLGLACCVLIYLFVADELSFDRFHEKAGSIYALVCRNEFHNETYVGASMGTGPVLERDFPEVERAVRIYRSDAAARYGDKIFKERPHFVDPSFFDVFSFPLVAGQAEAVLQAEGSIVLTESAARKYFGRGRSLGETLSLTFGDIQKEFFVSGICKDPPVNSSIRFDMLINISDLRNIEGPEFMTQFRWMGTPIYVLLRDGASPEAVNARFPSFLRQYFQQTLQEYKDSGSWKKEGDVLSFRLENIRKLHLSPEIHGLGIGSRSIQSSLILAGIGILILIIACINFVNLSLGRASARTLEVGMRKVLGARRKHLIHQFWAESLVLSFLAMALGLLIARSALPVFNALAEKNLNLKAFFTAPNLLIFVGILIAVAVASGSFPGLFLSRLDPVDVLRAKTRWSRRSLFSRALVVVQFALAVFLLVMTFTMAGQFRYISRADLGFDEEGIIVVDLQEEFERGPQSEALIDRFRTELTGNRAVMSISGSIMNFNRLMVMSHIDVKGTVTDIFFNRVTHDYLKTMGIKLLEGRDFSRDFSTNASSVIVNRAFVKRFGLESPLGLTIYDAYERDEPLTSVGVVEDYHFQPMKYAIAPVILHMKPEETVRDMLVRVTLDDIPGTIKALQDVWNSLRPDKPFLYSFMDRDIEDSYNRQKRWTRIVEYSSILAVFISSLGIFAMTVISIARRVREIGIRRVMGAGTGTIVGLISREFIPMVAAANIAAWPFAFYAAHHWLQGFAFRTSLSPGVFVFALLLSLFVALATVGVLAFRAALVNPAQSLRVE